MPPMPPVQVRNAGFRLDQALVELERLIDEHQERLAGIRRSTEWSELGLQQREDALVMNSTAAIEAQKAAVDDARTALLRVADDYLAAQLPTGADLIAYRVEAANASDRVRRLLDRNADPSEIIRRATDTNDALTLRALRDEAEWINPASESLHAWVGRWREDEGGAPSGMDAGELLRLAADRALVEVLPNNEAGAIQARLDLAAQNDHIDVVIARAIPQLTNGPDLGSTVADQLAGYSRGSGFVPHGLRTTADELDPA